MIDFGFNPVSKPQHNRRTPKKKARGEFSEKTKKAIGERDNWQCVKCGSYHLETVPHHITYKSHGGLGEKRNGASICRRCHDWSHGKCKGPNGELAKEGRYWFEMWRDENLDENGDMRNDTI
ncbi:HNH endonuclease [Priestia megaterium]|uniref:HNH endonuclease n=1 Tax=Priestia megaterium TaxID=1404 RepID=UPI002E1AD3A9|nr:HNH endonuclease [Priestia megaterium]MED3974577.1 HNH endonuclease [Priestia megaterium]